MRVVIVAAAQLGPIQKADSREAVVKRLIALMDEAQSKGADLIVYPELALTTFFPRWYMEDQAEVDAWFEREMPNVATKPLFERAAHHQIAMNFGYAELTPDGHHFNTSILTDKSGKIVGKYRKVICRVIRSSIPNAPSSIRRSALFRSFAPSSKVARPASWQTRAFQGFISFAASRTGVRCMPACRGSLYPSHLFYYVF
jgi:hypothetical protein